MLIAPMASGAAKKTGRSLSRPFVVTVAAVVTPGAMIVVGCGTAHPDPAGGGVGGTSGGDPGGNPALCTDEGAKRACHISLASNHGFQGCFYGSQYCVGGSWSACSDSPDGTIVNSLPGTAAQAFQNHVAAGDPQAFQTNISSFATFTDAGSNQGNCATDPCDPGCNSWNQNQVPPTTPIGGGIGTQGFGQVPPGQLKKLLNDNCRDQDGDNQGGGGNCNTQNPPGTLWQCQMDTYCEFASGCCKQHLALDIYGTTATIPYGASDSTGVFPTVTATPNITLGPGCNFSDKQPYDYFPLCNRGNAPAVVPSIAISIMNPQGSVPTGGGAPCNAQVPGSGVAYYPTSCTTNLDATTIARCPAGTPGCQVTPGQLDPGMCVLAKLSADCPGGVPNGIRWMFVNADNTVNEGFFGYDTVNFPGQTTPIKGCADNWSDVQGNNNNPPSCFGTGGGVTFTNEYFASCPPGFAPQWSKLTWNANNNQSGGQSSEVLFEAATAPNVGPPGTPTAGAYGAYYEIGEAQQDCDFADPEQCFMNGGFTGAGAGPCSAAGGGIQKIQFCSNEFANGNINNGPAPGCCPKDFLDQFSRPNPLPGGATGSFTGVAPPDPPALQYVQQPFLKLRVSLKSTPDGKKTATLNSWAVSFVCVGSE
jgi:hypothetical protein